MSNVDTLQDHCKLYTSSLSLCSCGGLLNLMKEKIVHAELYGMSGILAIKHQAKRCSKKYCRTIYWINHKWQNGDKISCVSLNDVTVLFMSDKAAFEVIFLAYHEDLHYRGFLSTSTVIYAIENQFSLKKCAQKYLPPTIQFC